MRNILSKGNKLCVFVTNPVRVVVKSRFTAENSIDLGLDISQKDRYLVCNLGAKIFYLHSSSFTLSARKKCELGNMLQ